MKKNKGDRVAHTHTHMYGQEARAKWPNPLFSLHMYLMHLYQEGPAVLVNAMALSERGRKASNGAIDLFGKGDWVRLTFFFFF